MKKLMLAFAVSLAAALSAEPVKALLVVQNHVGPEFAKPLTSLTARLSAALSGEVFEIIDPGDRVGVNQNRSAPGEAMPASSATRLAENLGASALITASVDDLSDESVAAGRVMRKRATITLQVKRLPDGVAVIGDEATVISRNFTPAEFAANSRAVYSDLISAICRRTATALIDRAAKVKFERPTEKVTVGFACNYPGATVSVDGLTLGSAGTIGEPPLKVQVAPGVHHLAVSYPFTVPYEFDALLADGAMFVVKLEENAAGRVRRQQDAMFAETLDRIHKQGATDDLCRTMRAKGYGQFLSNSHSRIEGMPQTITENIFAAPPPVEIQ